MGSCHPEKVEVRFILTMKQFCVSVFRSLNIRLYGFFIGLLTFYHEENEILSHWRNEKGGMLTLFTKLAMLL